MEIDQIVSFSEFETSAPPEWVWETRHDKDGNKSLKISRSTTFVIYNCRFCGNSSRNSSGKVAVEPRGASQLLLVRRSSAPRTWWLRCSARVCGCGADSDNTPKLD
ncbi:hypothetical protein Zmor_009180 [Zophobas morio]|uniref:Uncharacterized protein n=1 Tax=Zophobas morio TaxID=2755281 RepID=A0AA38INN6_9CUCU|nr:hypothetical protein Zmor_009180 [Zophobas morio]